MAVYLVGNTDEFRGRGHLAQRLGIPNRPLCSLRFGRLDEQAVHGPEMVKDERLVEGALASDRSGAGPNDSF